MKILHINSYYSVSPFYGQLYDRQIASGSQVDVYIPVARGFDERTVSFDGYVKLRPNHGKYDRAIFHLKHQKILRDVVRQYDVSKYDVIHAHSLFSNGYIAYKLNKRYGVPYIVAVRDSDVNAFFKYMPHLRWLGKRILSAAKHVVFLSSSYRDHALVPYLTSDEQEALLRKAAVLPNGIDAMWLENKGTPRTPPKKTVHYLFVGQLIGRKNVEKAIATVEMLRRGGQNARLTVVGAAMDSKELEKVQACKYATYVEPLPKEELIELYRACDILLVPSQTETFGLVYAEALSQGLPVLYTRGQGFDGQFPDGEVGYAVNPADARDIADAALRIVAEYEEMSARCIEHAVKFDWDAIERAYDVLYEGK